MRLNKSCTVANIFWSLNVLAPELISEEHRRIQAFTDKSYVLEERKMREAELQRL